MHRRGGATAPQTTQQDGTPEEMSPTRLTSEVVTLWVHECARVLAAARAPLDEANVFPVADSDTGTNLWLTVREGAARVDAVRRTAPAGSPPDVVALLRAFARGALDGARGNSGVILSEYLRGFVAGAGGSSTREASGLDAGSVRTGLVEAARRANESVGQPVGGTILTAATWAARAAWAAGPSAAVPSTTAPARSSPSTGQMTVADVVEAAVDGARQAIEHSPAELEVLRSAQLVDAGAVGLLLVLRSLGTAARGATGEDLAPVDLGARAWATAGGPSAPERPAGPDGARVPADPGHAGAVSHVAGPSSPWVAGAGGEFEVMLAAWLPGSRVDDGEGRTPAARLRDRLVSVGDSVVVVDDSDDLAEPRVRVHVHADSPAAVVDAVRGWTVDRAVVHQLTRAREHTWAVVGVTRSPGLLDHVARSASVALWAQDGRVPDVDLERALVDAHATTVILVPGRTVVDADLAQRAADVGRAAGLTVVTALPSGTRLGDGTTLPGGRALRAGTRAARTASAPSDPHLVAALAAAQMIDVTVDDPHDAVERVAAAVCAVRHGTIEVQPGAHGGTAAVGNLAAQVRALLADGAEVLSVVPDDGVPEPVVAQIVTVAEAAGAEAVVVRSGLAGSRCVLGAEPGAVLDV